MSLSIGSVVLAAANWLANCWRPTGAIRSNARELLACGRALAYHAETYAVDALEQHLQNYPALISRVEYSNHEV